MVRVDMATRCPDSFTEFQYVMFRTPGDWRTWVPFSSSQDMSGRGMPNASQVKEALLDSMVTSCRGWTDTSGGSETDKGGDC